ncbi:hypothetical protein PLESTF_000262200 [Pleodorina starrii]|nr:hypothetical protein PLESTF_000262200 [Pleodorina starrii]
MANELGVPLRPIPSVMHASPDENQTGGFELDVRHIHDERARERGLKTRARRAVGAARGVVGVVRACGHRIAFRCRNRTAYPRRCLAPRAVFITAPQQPLSAMSLGQLDALRANLEAEEAGLMEKLRELWQHLSMGAHLQPAFVDPDRLAHVTRLLLSGDTDAVERDPDNDEVSGAATMTLTSQRLEAALVEVHDQIQRIAEERRRRKGLHGAAVAASEPAARHAPSPAASPRRNKPHAAGGAAAAAAGGAGAKRALSFSAGGAASSAASSAVAHGSGRADENPKRKLSLSSLSRSLMQDCDAADKHQSRDAAGGARSPRPKALARLRARLSRRGLGGGNGGGVGTEVPCSWPAREGDGAQELVDLQQLGYTQLPTQE